MSTLEQIYWIVILLTGFIASINPSRGIILTVIIGFIQEPIRKILPGQPVYIVISLLIPFAGALWGSFASSAVQISRNFFRLYPQLLIPTQMSLVLIIYQITNAFAFSNSIPVIIIGVTNYIVPIFALLVAFQFANDKKNALLLIGIYIIGATILSIGSVLNLNGYESILTESVGQNLYVYDDTGRKILRSGFFRAPEIAGHHCAMALILLVILVMYQRVLHRPDIIIILLIFTSILTIGLTLAGRRKTLIQIFFFIIVYFPLLRLTMRKKVLIDLPTILFAAGLITIGWWIITSIGATSAFESVATDRFGIVEDEELLHRAKTFLINAPVTAYETFGFLGGGAGLLSQGISAIWTPDMLLDLGLASTQNLWFAESGLGRLVGEYGMLGLIIMCFSFFAMYHVYFSSARYINHTLGDEYPIFIGLSLVIGVIQPMNFFMAAPAYSDPFVVISLALFVGVTLAIPTWGNTNK